MCLALPVLGRWSHRSLLCILPQICVESALQILEYQRILHEEVQVGGCLHHDQWKISSLATSGFLLATALLCVEIESSVEGPKNLIDTELRNKIIQALQDSY